MNSPLLEIRQIVKRFGGTLALDSVSFDVAPGEVHALLGQNGAGKSTVIKLLAGIYTLDAGEIRFRGESLSGGIDPSRTSFIHQDLGLIDELTVAENIALSAGYPCRGRLIGWREVRRRARDVLRSLDAVIDPNVAVASLTQGERAILGVARALAIEAANLLVMDEPTASLPHAEAARLFTALETLRSRGTGILYVTHKLDEVLRLADRVTVLRDGRCVATTRTSETTSSALVEMIVGHSVGGTSAVEMRSEGSQLVRLDRVMAAGVGPVSLTVSKSECVGLVGLQGSGHAIIGRAVFGLERIRSGQILLRDVPLRGGHPADAIRRGVGFVSGNRTEESIIPEMTVRENLFLSPRNYRSFRRIRRREEEERFAEVAEEFDIRPRGGERVIHTLSGGNQQKAVLARWLTQPISLLILEEPTAGVDVGAKDAIRGILRSFLARGGAAILLSSDFDDVVALANRAYVFHRGRIVDELERSQITISQLTAVAGGAHMADSPGSVQDLSIEETW